MLSLSTQKRKRTCSQQSFRTISVHIHACMCICFTFDERRVRTHVHAKVFGQHSFESVLVCVDVSFTIQNTSAHTSTHRFPHQFITKTRARICQFYNPTSVPLAIFLLPMFGRGFGWLGHVQWVWLTIVSPRSFCMHNPK